MLRALFTSATGLAAQQFNLDVVANNLANSSTVGFKRSRADFQDLIYQSTREPGSVSGTNSRVPTGSQVGLGVSVGTTTARFSQGTLQQTGVATDVAIKGDGFFKIKLPDGTDGYTRAGNFTPDASGRLVTPEGYVLQPEILVPQDRSGINISADGKVSVTRGGQTDVAGTISLVTFVNPSGLRAVGGNTFVATAASGQPQDATPGSPGAPTLAPGHLEQSNVDVVEEMVKMIVLQRSYDVNSKVILAADEMLATTTNIKR